MANSPRPPRRSVRLLRTPLHIGLQVVSSMYFCTSRVKNTIRYEISDFLSPRPSAGSVSRDVGKLGKTPQHISAIFEARSKNASFEEDTGRLIREAVEFATWCACAGIMTVSVYERQGFLKKEALHIYNLMLERFEASFPEDLPCISVLCPRKFNDPDSKAEMSDKGIFKLYLIAEEDGRDPITEMTQSLGKMVHCGKVTLDDVSMGRIEEELERVVMPDPDLIVVFGSCMKLSGYPPWQSRSAELSCLGDNHGLRYPAFLSALKAYDGAEMRNGK